MAKKTTKKPVKKATTKSSAKAKATAGKVAKKAVKKVPAKKKVATKKASRSGETKKVVKKVATKKASPKKIAAKSPAKAKVSAKKTAPKKATVKAEPKTNSISPYLIFIDNCEEAFNFYKSVFGGQFSYLGRFNEMPPMEGQPPMPASEANKIMHVSLPISKETVLMGSDSSEAFGHTTVIGNNFSISINAKSEKEADRLFAGLSEDGKVVMPMEKTFWGSYFGMLFDKFGVQWQVSFGN